jgi:predicted PurR-regulated permease PerM
MNTHRHDSDDLTRPGAYLPAPAVLRLPIAAGLCLAAFLALLGWAVLRSLGPMAIAIGAWFLAAALPRARERRDVRSLLILLGTLWIVHAARWVVYPLLAGILAALLLAPVVAWLESKRVRRPLAAVLVLLPIGLLVALALSILVPAITRQAQLILQKLPDAYAYLAEHGRGLLRLVGQETVPAPVSVSAPVPFPAVTDSLALTVRNSTGAPAAVVPLTEAVGLAGGDWLGRLTAHAESLLRAAFGGVSGIGKGLGRAAQYLGLFFLTPVVAYHLLVGREQFRAAALRWMPARWHEHALRVTGDIASSLQVYLRGQFLVAGLEAVLFSIVFAVAGLPQPVALGVIAGLLSLVPMLGFWLTILLVVLNAVTGPAPGATLLKAGVGILIINLIEGQILVPRIQGSGLGLHPLAVLFGVLLFGTIFGFTGVLLAIPAMGVIRAAVPRIEEAWVRSRVYRGGDRQTDSPGLED